MDQARLALGLGDEAGDARVLLVRDHRAEVGIGAAGADADPAGARGEPFDQLVGDARLDQELGRRGADLAGVLEGTLGHVGHDPVEVGVGEHQDRVLAAEFEHDRDRALGRHRHDRAGRSGPSR